MSRKIPLFAAIRAFEAVVRLGRNVDAAKELNVTGSAISHQIKSVYEPLRQALDMLDAAFVQYTDKNTDQSVSMHMYQSLPICG